MPTWLHRARHPANVSDTLFHRRKEMKYGAVVPHIVGVGGKFSVADIRVDPLDVFRNRTCKRFFVTSMAVWETSRTEMF
jgi:hypothetical protein